MSDFIKEEEEEVLNILILYDINLSNLMKLNSIILDNNNNDKIDFIILCMNEKNKSGIYISSSSSSSSI